MNRTTGAQRANARYDAIWAEYRALEAAKIGLLQFTVARHARYKHGHGYTLRPNRRLDYLTGDGLSMGWYKYKRDALARADALNADYRKNGERVKP